MGKSIQSGWVPGLVLVVAAGLAGCEPGTRSAGSPPFTPATLRALLENATTGQVLTVPAGRYRFSRGLVLTQDGVTVRGAGMGKTILDFSQQVAGGEGWLVTSNDVVIEALSLVDPPGDALRVQGAEGVVIRQVQAAWTRGPHPDNGAYGLYPVECTNVLVEDSVASGASDAGIYVGQSTGVILRRNTLFDNVAGIEVENSQRVDVLGNTASGNTVGLVVQNLLDLPIAGHSVRLSGNTLLENNLDSFAAPGSPVSLIPSGSGVYIGAFDRVEIENNQFDRHDTASILIASYIGFDLVGRELHKKLNDAQGPAGAPDPYSTHIAIQRNRMAMSGQRPRRADFEAVRRDFFSDEGRLPSIIWDGSVLPNGPVSICSRESAPVVLNLALDDPAAMPAARTVDGDCEFPGLSPVDLGRSESLSGA